MAAGGALVQLLNAESQEVNPIALAVLAGTITTDPVEAQPSVPIAGYADTV